MAGSFKKINASGSSIEDMSRVVNTIQGNVESAIKPFQNSQIVNGVLLQVSLATGANTITHKLGRKALGYVIVSQDAAATTYDNLQSAGTDVSFSITSSAATTAKLWVF